MDYRDEVFISVAENLSFSKAAKELYISQPAVTKHIKELENRLSIALFNRKGNKIYLTKAGELTYRYYKEINQKYIDFEYALGRLSDAFKGVLSIGASSTISQYLIPGVIASFHRKYLEIKLNLYNGNSFEMERKLLDGEIDLALVENDSSNKNISYTPFLEDEIVVVAGSNCLFAKQKNLSIKDLEQIPIVLREKGSGTLQVIEKALHAQGIDIEKLNILIHLGSTEAILNFICDFDGIAMVSERSIQKELILKNLSKINVKNFSINRQFRIGFRHGPDLPIPKLFTDFLYQYNF